MIRPTRRLRWLPMAALVIGTAAPPLLAQPFGPRGIPPGMGPDSMRPPGVPRPKGSVTLVKRCSRCGYETEDKTVIFCPNCSGRGNGSGFAPPRSTPGPASPFSPGPTPPVAVPPTPPPVQPTAPPQEYRLDEVPPGAAEPPPTVLPEPPSPPAAGAKPAGPSGLLVLIVGLFAAFSVLFVSVVGVLVARHVMTQGATKKKSRPARRRARRDEDDD